MKLTAKAMVYPAIITIILVVIPRIAVGLIPAGIEEVVSIIFDFNAVISTLTAVGIALAAMSFIKNTTDFWSPVNLLASIASELGGLYLFIFFIGLGEVAVLGSPGNLSQPGREPLWCGASSSSSYSNSSFAGS